VPATGRGPALDPPLLPVVVVERVACGDDLGAPLIAADRPLRKNRRPALALQGEDLCRAVPLLPHVHESKLHDLHFVCIAAAGRRVAEDYNGVSDRVEVFERLIISHRRAVVRRLDDVIDVARAKQPALDAGVDAGAVVDLWPDPLPADVEVEPRKVCLNELRRRRAGEQIRQQNTAHGVPMVRAHKDPGVEALEGAHAREVTDLEIGGPKLQRPVGEANFHRDGCRAEGVPAGNREILIHRTCGWSLMG